MNFIYYESKVKREIFFFFFFFGGGGGGGRGGGGGCGLVLVNFFHKESKSKQEDHSGPVSLP